MNHTKYVFLSNALRQARRTKRWTQQQLADHMDVDVDVVDRIECGETQGQLGTIYLMCELLGVNFEHLFSPDDQANDVVVPFPATAERKK